MSPRPGEAGGGSGLVGLKADVGVGVNVGIKRVAVGVGVRVGVFVAVPAAVAVGVSRVTTTITVGIGFLISSSYPTHTNEMATSNKANIPTTHLLRLLGESRTAPPARTAPMRNMTI